MTSSGLMSPWRFASFQHCPTRSGAAAYSGLLQVGMVGDLLADQEHTNVPRHVSIRLNCQRSTFVVIYKPDGEPLPS